MKLKKQRFLAWLMSAAIIISLMPTTASASHELDVLESNPTQVRQATLQAYDLSGQLPGQLADVPLKELIGQKQYDACVKRYGKDAVVTAGGKPVEGGLDGSVDMAHHFVVSGGEDASLKVNVKKAPSSASDDTVDITYIVPIQYWSWDDIVSFKVTLLDEQGGVTVKTDDQIFRRIAPRTYMQGVQEYNIVLYTDDMVGASTANVALSLSKELLKRYPDAKVALYNTGGRSYKTEDELLGAIEAGKAEALSGADLKYRAGWFNNSFYSAAAVLSCGGTDYVIPIFSLSLRQAERFIPARIYSNDELLHSVGSFSGGSQATGKFGQPVKVSTLTLASNSQYLANAQYWMLMQFKVGGYDEKDRVEAVYDGEYKSMSDARAQGAENIKDLLFAPDNSGVKYQQDFVHGGYPVNLSGDGVTFTIFDQSGTASYCRYILNDSLLRSEDDALSNLASDTNFYVGNVFDEPSTMDSVDCLPIYRSWWAGDAAFDLGYQSILLLDKDYAPFPLGSTVYPCFVVNDKVSIYANTEGEENKPGEKASGQKQTPRQSPVILSEPVTTIHYSGAAENGMCLRNYWISLISPIAGKAELFVSGASNQIEEHKAANGNPQRIVNFTSRYSSDVVFVANIGDKTLTGLRASLSEDAKGIVLDQSGVKSSLSGFTAKAMRSVSNYDEDLPENACVFTLRPQEGYKGQISGTLTVSSANGGEVTIELTGYSGASGFEITTETMRNAVQYVPYDQAIQTSSAQNALAVSFELEGSLPDGLELYPNGVIYGVPLESGSFSVTVKAIQDLRRLGQYGTKTDTQKLVLNVLENTDENVWNATDVSSGGSDYRITTAIPNEDGSVGNINLGNQKTAETSGNSWSGDTQLLESQGPYNLFRSVYLDGQKLEPGIDYTSEEGSTRITLRTQTMQDSGTGRHTLAAEFYQNSGNDSTLRRAAQNFTVTTRKSEETPPQTPAVPVNPSVPSVPDVPSTPETVIFSDVYAGDWYAGSVQWAYQEGIMKGVGGGLFLPDFPVDPAAMATVLAGLTKADLSQYDQMEDPEVPSGQWYTNAMLWAKALNLFEEESISVQKAMRRGEAARILVTYLKQRGVDCTLPEQPVSFSDSSEIDAEELEALQILHHLDVLVGVGDLTIKANDLMTRAQFAVVLQRLQALCQSES